MDHAGLNWKNLLTLALAVGATAFAIARAPADDEAIFPMPAGKTYLNECGSCHTAFAPGLLPARSWRKMLAGLTDHFGEDASLDEPQRLAILKDLETLAADTPQANLRMRRINGAIPGNAAPQRITESGYFKFMHDEVPRHIWQRKKIGTPGNCLACHTRANEGRYGEREVRIPQ
ncbi:MAG: diheme cytochrome c [Pseudomonadota bacterium]